MLLLKLIKKIQMQLLNFKVVQAKIKLLMLIHLNLTLKQFINI